MATQFTSAEWGLINTTLKADRKKFGLIPVPRLGFQNHPLGEKSRVQRAHGEASLIKFAGRNPLPSERRRPTSAIVCSRQLIPVA